jgi:galactose mutarotase-like enzyme
VTPSQTGTAGAHQVVEGDGLTAVIRGRGGKVVSLRGAGGHEWLLPPIAGRPVVRGAAFVDADLGGWDECAPSIVACTAPAGEQIPDHGDLWDIDWVRDGDSDTGAAALLAYGSSLSYDMRRTVRPVASGLRFDYRVTTRRRVRTPFLWAAHPQFLAPAGSHLLIDCATVVDALDHGVRQAWTPGLATIDSVEPGGCRKVYAEPDWRVESVTLVVPDAGELTLRWDPAVTPYAGLWFDQGAYARRPVIAIEPSTGFYDSLAAAVDNDRVLWIEPSHPVSWWVEVTAA